MADLAQRLATAERERDEARAQVTDLLPRLDADELMLGVVAGERDRAEAEVERLNVAVASALEHCEVDEAALKRQIEEMEARLALLEAEHRVAAEVCVLRRRLADGMPLADNLIFDSLAERLRLLTIAWRDAVSAAEEAKA